MIPPTQVRLGKRDAELLVSALGHEGAPGERIAALAGAIEAALGKLLGARGWNELVELAAAAARIDPTTAGRLARAREPLGPDSDDESYDALCELAMYLSETRTLSQSWRRH